MAARLQLCPVRNRILHVQQPYRGRNVLYMGLAGVTFLASKDVSYWNYEYYGGAGICRPDPPSGRSLLVLQLTAELPSAERGCLPQRYAMFPGAACVHAEVQRLGLLPWFGTTLKDPPSGAGRRLTG